MGIILSNLRERLNTLEKISDEIINNGERAINVYKTIKNLNLDMYEKVEVIYKENGDFEVTRGYIIGLYGGSVTTPDDSFIDIVSNIIMDVDKFMPEEGKGFIKCCHIFYLFREADSKDYWFDSKGNLIKI